MAFVWTLNPANRRGRLVGDGDALSGGFPDPDRDPDPPQPPRDGDGESENPPPPPPDARRASGEDESQCVVDVAAVAAADAASRANAATAPTPRRAFSTLDGGVCARVGSFDDANAEKLRTFCLTFHDVRAVVVELAYRRVLSHTGPHTAAFAC